MAVCERTLPWGVRTREAVANRFHQVAFSAAGTLLQLIVVQQEHVSGFRDGAGRGQGASRLERRDALYGKADLVDVEVVVFLDWQVLLSAGEHLLEHVDWAALQLLENHLLTGLTGADKRSG